MSRWLLAASLGLLLLLSYLTGIRVAYTLAYTLVALFAAAYLWPLLLKGKVKVTRSLEAGQPTVGEAFEENFVIRKRTWVPAPWVEVRDLGQVAGYQPGRVLSVGRTDVKWTARGIYPSRGWQTFGPSRIRVSEPFGLFSREEKAGERVRVLVYPRVQRVPELAAPADQHAGDAPRYGSWADYPPETGGVRDYAPGDAFGRIHWPLSIKHETLMSKTFEQPLTADLWIVLDLHAGAHYSEGPESTLEYGVSLAASIAMQVHTRGRLVGLVANDARGTLLEPHRAVRQDRVILDFLAIAQADGRASLATSTMWDRVRRLPRRALAVITPSNDGRWVGALQSARHRSTAVMVFYIDASTFGAPAQDFGLELGSDADLYVVRRGEDFGRMMRTRDAVRFG